MRKVKIITDSTSDLNKEEIEKYEIEVLPLHVNFGEETFLDNVSITVDKLYEMVNERGVLPKTSAINVMDFVNVFEKYLNLGYDIIYTGISSYMSSTFNNARLAIDELDASEHIFVVDSKNLSSGIGLLLLKACKLKEEGMEAKQIALKMEEIVPKIRSQFVIDTFDYLYKGGRCSSMAKIFGTMLKIKPIIVVRDGKMSVALKPHGKIEKALDQLINMITKDKDNLDGEVVMVTHSKAKNSAIYLCDKLNEVIDTKEIMETNAGCVISSHCGPGTIGILYVLK